MAKGIAVGLLIGLVGGLVATLIQGASGRPATGLPAAGLVLGWALVGGAFGALIGSFVRLRVAPDDVVLALQPDEAPATDEAATLMVTGIQARHDHAGARVGALVGSVAIGPLGMPIGAAAGAVVDAMTPGPDAPPSHTHNIELNPCYDGCPAWRHSRK